MFSWFRKSIKRKIAIVLITVPALVAIFIVMATQTIANNSLVRAKMTNIKNATISEAVNVADSLDTAASLSKSIASTQRAIDFLKSRDPSNVPNIIYSLGYLEQISTIKILDTEGAILASQDRKNIGEKIDDKKLLEEALAKNDASYTKLDLKTREVKYHLTSKVKDPNGSTLGFVVVTINTDPIFKNLDKTALKDVGDVMIVSEDGLVYHSSNTEDHFKSLWTLDKIEKDLIFLKTGLKNIDSLRYEDIKNHVKNYNNPSVFETVCSADNNEREIISIAKAGDYPIYIVAEINRDKVTANLLSGFSFLAFLSFGLIALGALVVTKYIYHFIKPIKNIQKALEGINNGDSYQDMNIKTIDEFKEISEIVDQIGHKLSDKNCKKCVSQTEKNENIESR